MNHEGTHESQTGYQRGERVPLHVKSFQKLQAFILQQVPGESSQIPVVQKEVFVTFLLGDKNSMMQFNCHLQGQKGRRRFLLLMHASFLKEMQKQRTHKR